MVGQGARCPLCSKSAPSPPPSGGPINRRAHSFPGMNEEVGPLLYLIHQATPLSPLAHSSANPGAATATIDELRAQPDRTIILRQQALINSFYVRQLC